MSELNALAMTLGWILIIGVGAIAALVGGLLFWRWLTEQIWEAGYRVQKRWAKRGENPDDR